jgi:outer membrane protein OmpA-like peptidoglycan-associated protein
MSTRILTLTTAVVIAALAAVPAHAQGGVEFGGFGSYTQYDTSLTLKERAGAGARLSLISGHGWSTFILEAEGGYSEQTLGLPATVKHIPARARLLYAFPLGSTASLLIGGGGVRNEYMIDTTHSNDWGYTALAGLRVKLGSFMSLRLDAVVDYIENPVNESDLFPRNINKALHAGLQFPLWKSKVLPPVKEKPQWKATETQAPPKEEPKPEPVKEEAAPQPAQPAPAPVQELAMHEPDADRDAVPDSRDLCAATAPGSTVDAQGCQVYRDTDDDGVTDVRDRCPATPHATVIDGYGCPARPVEAARDTDGDGIEDSRDKCPATPAGTHADASGCPIVIPKMEGPRTVTLRGVTFMSGRDELTPSSLVVLDEVAKQLVAVPELKIEIAGHTDSKGTRIRNIRLSLARAEAVRAYLVMQGVPAERLSARGYGPDKPVASNAGPNGRAMNRRVELKRLD